MMLEIWIRFMGTQKDTNPILGVENGNQEIETGFLEEQTFQISLKEQVDKEELGEEVEEEIHT